MVKKDRIKNLAYKMVENLAGKGIPVERLILYGSYVKGVPKSYSDIDVAVISSAFEGRGILKRQELLGEALCNIGEPVEALGYTPKECRKPSPLSFISEILATGKLIYKS